MRGLWLLLLLGALAAQAATPISAPKERATLPSPSRGEGPGERVAPAGPFKDAQCIACHGPDSPEVQGWRLSKHGVLVRISTPGRAPGCVDCHGAEAHHPANPEAMREVCGKCHSPRYLDTLAANGLRMVAVGEMKQREALALLTQARRRFQADRLQAMEDHYHHLQTHLRNIRLGVGHQSPDHQWWHGHPALDGDLLRIKGAYDEVLRTQR